MIWRHLFGYLPASLAGGLASFGAVFVYTRLMSAENYGFYALALTTMSVVYTLSITWAEAAAFRFEPEASAKGALPSHVRTLLWLAAGSVLLALAAMLATLPFAGHPSMRMALAAAAGAMILAPLINVAQELNRAQGRVARYAAIRTFQDVGAFALGALLAWRTGFGPAAPFVGLASVLAVLAVIEGLRLVRASNRGQFDPARVRPYLAYGVPVALALALNIALDTGDRFLIALFLGPEAVAVYAAGYGIADKTIGLVCNLAAMAGAPLMLAAWETKDAAAMEAASSNLARLLLLIATPAAAGLALVAGPLAEVMIGESVRGTAAALIPWIAFSGLLNGFVLYYFSEAFLLSRRTDLRAGLMLIPALANLALNIVLLPRIGLMGAVYSTVACYGLALVLLAWVGRRLAPLSWPSADMVKIGASCAAMAICVALIPAWGGLAELLAKSSAGAIAYVACVLALDASGARTLLEGLRRRPARA
ncbi:MAG: lipopolysaccharide biosynthesis protein [Alphaproteobacteria bacterium]|nr:lipopolysaccharide biosynthesis protein [Alphaproteobacteria bacterium]